MSNPLLLEIHRYWFGELKSPGDHLPNTGELWFRKSDENDRHIRQAFEPFIHKAAGKNWDVSSLTREEGVGLVVLFDQFPRNIFRNSGQQFAFDPKAREIAEALTSSGIDRFFSIERDLLSLPFQHHEDAASQDRAVLMAAEMAVGGPESMRQMHRSFLDFACKHRDLIRKLAAFRTAMCIWGGPRRRRNWPSCMSTGAAIESFFIPGLTFESMHCK